MVDYIPGEKGLAVAKGIRPSLAAELAFERGFYEGDYTVVPESKVLFRPQMEQIRRAAETKWPSQIVAFDDIVAWTDEDAPDLLTGSFEMAGSPLSAQRRAVLLINNGVFERHL